MRTHARHAFLAALAAVIAACAPRPAPPAPALPNAELARLYEEDQGERGDDFFQRVSSSPDSLRAQMARDAVRIATVRAAVASGRARTSADFYHAAMVAQHGDDTTAYRQASEWSARALALDSSNADARHLTAMSHDRYLKALGRPQCYGTQITKTDLSRPWELYAVDSTCATDADRRRLGVPPLAVMRAKVDSMNAAERAPVVP
jgi:hypothetical protein